MKLLDYPNLLKSFIAELGKELAMRRTVWRVIPGTDHQFGSSEKQRRYDSMRLMEKVFKEMNPRELQTIVERIERKKLETSKPTPKLFSLVLLFLFLSFGTQAQNMPTNEMPIDTISDGILKIRVINDHLKFYQRDTQFDVTISFKADQDASFQFKEKFTKKGVFNILIQKKGIYQIKVRDSKTPCVYIQILDVQEKTIGQHSVIQCSEPVYPKNDKMEKTNKKPSRT
jgi:hypothetical protein